MIIATYVLNPDGTVPWFVNDGGYFPDTREGSSPQDWTMVGVVDPASGLTGFADVDALASYVVSIRDNDWTDIDGEPVNVTAQAAHVWSLLWQAPVPYPSDGGMYEWNETEQSWVETTI